MLQTLLFIAEDVIPYIVIKFTDISRKKIASILRKQSARRKQNENDILLVVCFTYYSTMKKEAIYSFVKAENLYQITCHIP
jgi:hypothetical protein